MDNAGNRTSKTDNRTNVTSNYGYDAIYELTGVTQGTTTTESYTYDPVGNRLSSLGVSSYTNNNSNELTATSNAGYGYDNNGNTITRNDSTGITTYTWDFENRLTSVTLPGSGGTVSFSYDPFGRRIKKVSSTGTSAFAYDGDNLIEETNSTGGVVARYSQGLNIDEPLAMLRSSTTSYYNADGLGTVTSLSNAAGALAQTYTFDSFGKQTATSGSLTNPFQYTGRESDSETGLYYYRARYYDAGVARFVNEDPIGFKGGLNFYRYVFNNPALLTDPSGRVPRCVATREGIVCDGDQSPVDFQKSQVQALFPGSKQGGSTTLILPMSCDEAQKKLEKAAHYFTGHFWDSSPYGSLTLNPFLFWDPIFHAGGREWRSSRSGIHFRMKYGKACDKTCTLDEFHIDEHNPVFDPMGHLAIDVPSADSWEVDQGS